MSSTVRRRAGRRSGCVLAARRGAAGRDDDPAIADLAALLGVERRAVEHETHARRGALDALHGDAVAQDREYAAVAREAVVARELGVQRRKIGDADDGAFLARVGARAVALLAHRGMIARDVDRDPGLARDLLRELERKAERIVQREGVRAAERAARRARGVDVLREDLAAPLERPLERRFLAPEPAHDPLLGARELRIAGRERRDDGRHEPREKTARIAEEPPVTDRAPDEETEHVPAVGVARIDAVGDQEGRRTRVIGDDAPADQLLGRSERRLPDGRLRVDEIREQIGLVHRGEPVRDREDALEAHPRVDILRLELGERAVRAAVVLLEDEIPDLDVAIAEVGPGIARTARVPGTRIVKDLARGAARPRRAHRPEIILIEPRDARRVEADLGLPDALRVVIGRVDRDVELRRVEADRAGEKLPRPRDRVALVVVAERKIPEHLEEGAVPPRAADVLDIGFRTRDAQAALHRDGARPGRTHVAEERRDELLHPGDREQRRREFGRHERCRRRVHVAPRDEKVDERAPQLLARNPHGATEFPAAARGRLSLLGLRLEALLFDETAPEEKRTDGQSDDVEDDSRRLRRHAFEYTSPGQRSERKSRNFSSAFCCRRDTCICETLSRFAISVCEIDS